MIQSRKLKLNRLWIFSGESDSDAAQMEPEVNLSLEL